MAASIQLRESPVRPLRLLLALAITLLSGCAATDPLYQDGRWEAKNANQANLVVQVADPNDLIHGRKVSGADGMVAAAAVTRLRQDRVKKLPDSGLAQITLSPGSAGSDAPVSGTGGL